jgi:predicted short-subunit dehydrogenase-like oxidoreductase (DUF2520 family)
MPSPSTREGFLVEKNKLSIGFIGAGTVGTALAIILGEKGYNFVGASRRSTAGPNVHGTPISNFRILPDNQSVADAADLVFITTSDDAIAPVAREVRWRSGQSVVHCSGADSTAVLEPARKAGTLVGGFHPLQTFAGVRQAVENLPGSTFALEAEEPLLTTLKRMAEDAGGHWITLNAADKPAYHAAAVLASNYLVTLVKMATDLWKTFDIPADEAVTALMPLIRGTLHNIETVGLPNCLTGPIARGDAGTISKHLATLGAKTPSLLPAYRALGLQTIPVALAKGKINEGQAREMETVLTK